MGCKVNTGQWNNERLVGLAPEAQLLWLFFLTGPHAAALPGLWTIGLGRMAEGAGIGEKAARSAIAAMQGRGLLDYEPRLQVLHVPSVPKHNRPDNARVLAAWFRVWRGFPECPQKRAYAESLRVAIGDDTLISAQWAETFGKGSLATPPQTRRRSRPTVIHRDQEIPRRTLIAVAARDAGLCRYCERLADSIDHILPRRQGGGNEATNLATCCLECNTFKGNRTPEQAGMVLLPSGGAT